MSHKEGCHKSPNATSSWQYTDENTNHGRLNRNGAIVLQKYLFANSRSLVKTKPIV